MATSEAEAASGGGMPDAVPEGDPAAAAGGAEEAAPAAADAGAGPEAAEAATAATDPAGGAAGPSSGRPGSSPTGGSDEGQQGAQAAAPAQPNGYARFREMLRHPSAQPVVTQLQIFVQKFPPGLSRNDAARRIHKFLTTTQEKMLSECVVFAADADEEGRSNAAEGLEKFLLSRLHHLIFAVDPADLQEDAKLQERIACLSWVSFQHLGVPPVEPSLLTLAVNELRRVDDYKAPRDKLVCILNASRVINDVLKRTLEDAGVAGRPLSADDFLPLLIYCVITANPPRLHSNVEFVAAFRHPSRLIAEDAYFLTALQSATAFVKDATHKALDVTEDEFKTRCATSLAAWQREHPGGINGAESPPLGREAAGDEAGREGPGQPACASTVAAKAAELPAPDRQGLAEKVRALPFRFEAVLSARQLRVDQVEALLEEYKEMAKLLRFVETVGSPNG